MKKYKVVWHQITTEEYTIEANSKEDAINKLMEDDEIPNPREITDNEFEVTEITKKVLYDNIRTSLNSYEYKHDKADDTGWGRIFYNELCEVKDMLEDMIANEQ